MFNRLAYIEELRLQLEFVDTIEDYEEIMETITELEDGMYAQEEYELELN